jgi:hypothetical protein
MMLVGAEEISMWGFTGISTFYIVTLSCITGSSGKN